MVEIKHKVTGAVLHTVDAETLRGADLTSLNLVGADLSQANLSHANLSGADLTGAFLFGTDLSGIIAPGINLTGANLAGADLAFAILLDANLSGANLSPVFLVGANLSGANLAGANFEATILQGTAFGNCERLHEAQGLEQMDHVGPSYLDVATLRSCVCHLPDVFLLGVGYTKPEIENLREMYRQGISFYSCFLSYAHLNSDFADRLRTDLIANSVSCWQDSQDLRSGQKWEDQIGKAIKDHEKLILICSRQAIYRPNVVKEILQAIGAERETGEQKLFPIRLDNHILSSEMTEEAREKVRSGEWPENWVYYVCKFQIPDFSRWKNHDAYRQEFQKLLRDLKNPVAR